MMEGLQTPDAVDASPDHLPVSPHDPSTQQELQWLVSDAEFVTQAAVQQTTRNGYGPLEIVFGATDDEQARESVRNVACPGAGELPGGIVGRVREQPFRPCRTVQFDSAPAGSLLVWQHPLIPHVRLAAQSLGYSPWAVSFHWPVEPDTLPISNGLSRTAQATLSGWFEANVDDDSAIRAIKQNLISAVPRETVTDVEHVEPSYVPTRHNLSETGLCFEISLSHCDRRCNDQSSIYCVDGADISTIIETQSNTDHAHLTITSPPYLDVIDYETAAGESDADWSGPTESTDDSQDVDTLISDWQAVQKDIFDPIYDATAEGGFCAVVIGHVQARGEWVPLPHEFVDVMKDIGWNFHERIIWNKVTGGSNRFGTTIQNPTPTAYYPNQQHEEIQIWRKGETVRRNPTETLEMSELMKKEIANNTWNIAPVPHNSDIEHPCPFPEEIAHRLTLLYSCPGDAVVDPFSGSGTVPTVADQLGRVGIGTELNPAFVAGARRRLRDGTYTRNDQLLPQFESIDGDSPQTRIRKPDTTSDTSTTQSSLTGF